MEQILQTTILLLTLLSILNEIYLVRLICLDFL
jgi:hypothetical protein